MKTQFCKFPFFILWMVLCATQTIFGQKNYKISSPNNKLSIELVQGKDGILRYSVDYNNARHISPSPLGFKLKNGESIPSKDWMVENVSQSNVRSVWKPIWGKRSIVPEVYHETAISMVRSTGSGLKKIEIIARAYDDGVAFKYIIPKSESASVEVESELTAYNFSEDYTAWFYNGEYHNMGPLKLSSSSGSFLPVMTIEVNKDCYMAIHEADLKTGEPLKLFSEQGSNRFSVISKPKNLAPGYTSAWRVILLGATPGQLIDSHLIELLNPEPPSEIDFSWVEPSVSVWDWRINGAEIDGFTYTMSYPSWIRMVDFAAEQGFKHFVLDANWYGPEFEKDSDPTKGDKASDVKKLIAYAKEKKVGIWLYLNDVAGKQYDLEETLKQYGAWGATGVKYGFMLGSPEEKNIQTRKITEWCAENHLLINFHDAPVHPYGQMRTWPNAVTREYCHAQLDAHRVFLPKTFVTSVFVNMIAGPLDMNNGMFDLRQGRTTRVDENQPVPSTVVSEAARTLIVFSGATILPDIPEFYKKYPELLKFISEQKMPWKESKTLDGKIGEYIVMMRETDNSYLIGAANNEQARSLDLDLSFLPKGKYELLLIQDGDGADYITNRETYKVEERIVDSSTKVTLNLAAGGGSCLIIKKNYSMGN